MASKSIPPSRPPGLSGGKSSLPLIRAGMGAPEITEIEAWTDDDYRRATGLFAVLPANGQVDRRRLPAFEPAALRDAYRAMLRARALDAAARELVRAERIGSYAETLGTEAAVVGAVAALAPDDVVAPGRRQAAAALARGYPVAGLVAQLFGNAHDLARGRRLPGCPALPRALNILPVASHAGTQLPHAAGVAWAAKMQKKPTVALAYLDANEIDAEDFHTGVNFAGVFRLPTIFVCLNDGKHASLMTSETVAVRALAYGIAGVRVDGGDFLAVAASVREAAARGRRGEGATLIEAVVGQGEGERDGIARLRAWLAAEKVLDAAAEAAMRGEVDAELRAALAAEEPLGPPPTRSIIEQVLAQPTRALEDQLDELDRVRDKTVRP
ncbi:MAG TPA: thiamine pyrophosphate-dependent enzyme [Polyangia bacterium]|jgi:TPP-dependent pyruvate/acetoin dehydrogenase alpha subunit|nr:thiamine pyrophosphate-dependent enzyme [Polyangia bacterium]